MKNMQKSGKIALLCVMLAMIAVFPAFSQAQEFSLGDLTKTMDEFAGNMAKSLPFNAGMGMNWADAYIGNFPHFGVGFSFGFTTMDDGSFGDLLSNFAFSLPGFVGGFGAFPVPGYAVEARMGGFVLPFDMGFKFGYLPIKPGNFDSLDYFLVGGDVRYAVLKEGVLAPSVSISAGFNYMSGGIGLSVGEDIRYAGFDPEDDTRYIELSKPKVNIDWATSSLDFKAQVSKSFLILTPYLGLGLSNGWSRAGYGINTTITDSKVPSDIDQIKELLKKFDIYDFDETGFSSETEETGLSFRLFGGVSFDVAIFKIELTGLYNFRDGNYGVTAGARVQF